MKRIAFLGYNEPDGKTFGNGVARVIFNQAQLLKARGYQLFYYHLFSRKEYRDLNRFLRDNSIELAVWHMTTLKVRGCLRLPCPLICLWHSTPVFHQSMTELCKKYRVGSFWRNILNTRVVEWLYVSLHDLFNDLSFTYVTARADKMVLLSDQFKRKFFPTKLFPKKIKVIPNFISKNLIELEVDLSKKRKEVLFVGRLVNHQKRIDLLLQIWSIIEETVDDWVLNICGSGVDEEKLKQIKEGLGLKNVTFCGQVDPEEYYMSASIFCMTSALEGLPMVIEEASSYGCVPVAFHSFESIVDLITDGQNGRLIAPFDVEKYAEVLMELMSNEEERLKLAKNAKRDVSRFDPERIMDEWEVLFEEAK